MMTTNMNNNTTINLLKEGMEKHLVCKTTLTRKLTLDGMTQAYPVYRVRLDALYYNDQNDRIATWISKYKSEHEGKAPDVQDKESYNQVIENFIAESNPEAIRNTQRNIAMVKQREPGVTLLDGRVIDGNRRFTCLRRLAAGNPEFNWFETVILDRDLANSAKQIKILELSIQHGEEGRVDYNPIDRLVGLYNDVLSTGLLTPEEYASSVNMADGSKLKPYLETAQLMADFLEFINAPGQFYIARELQLNGPLEELQKLLKKCRTDAEKEDLKLVVFSNLLMQPVGDMTRYVRNIKSILGTSYAGEFLDEQTQIAMQVAEKLPETGKVTTAAIRDKIRTQEDLVEKLKNSMDKTLMRVKKDETRNRPGMLVGKAVTFLDGIDQNILVKLNDGERSTLLENLDRLDVLSRQLREAL